MNETKNFRIALIGCGAISGNHVRAILATNHTLVALCDIRPERARALIEQYELGDLPIFTDYREMIDEIRPDAVHICTPHDLHAPMTVFALERDVHVLCEKPMCINPKQMAEIRRVAGKSRAQLGYCFQNRYEPNMIRLRKLARERGVKTAFGSVVWKRDAAYYATDAWRGTVAHEGGGVMINQAIHTLDILQWICGEPTHVIAHVSNDCLQGVIEVEDTASARFETADGTSFFIFATNAAGSSLPVELQVKLADGTNLVAQNKHFVCNNEVETRRETPDAQVGKSVWGKGHTALIRDFYNCIEDGKPFPIGVDEGARAVRMILAMYRSNGQRVEIPKI